MPEYIEKKRYCDMDKLAIAICADKELTEDEANKFISLLWGQSQADVVEVVRCKDCIYFQPDYVLTNDGERRPYTDEEKEHDFGIVNMEKGINCGSRCERYEKWEGNNIPVWCNENDFCNYGKRKEESNA